MEERKVSVLKKEKTGQVKIADEVIAIIADLAITDVKGIVTLGTRKYKNKFGKGIAVRVDGNDVYVDVSVVLKNGTKAKDVAAPIQEKVKAALENMLDMTVREVNVSIVGIQNEKSESGEL